jgi:uncharacterized protein YdhG (YjbR/CyaY superfamily)
MRFLHFGRSREGVARRRRFMTDRSVARNIDEYIEAFPPEVQSILKRIRSTIRNAVPDAEEKISYQMPTFTLGGSNLIYYAAFKKHIGLYPPVKGGEKLNKEKSPYEGEKGNSLRPDQQNCKVQSKGALRTGSIKERREKEMTMHSWRLTIGRVDIKPTKRCTQPYVVRLATRW